MTKEEKCSISQKNRIVVHKGNKEKRVYSNELDKYLINGWEEGISEKHRNSMSSVRRGTHSWNTGKSPSQETKNKISSTLLSKYSSGQISVWNKGLTKETDNRVLNNSVKSTLTKVERYGSASPNYKKHLSEEHKAKIGKANAVSHKGLKLSPDKLQIKVTKEYLTKKKNNSFNTSKDEKILYENLLKDYEHKTIYRNYKDEERYPFYCDFYIKEDDLFIELNAHWTHGSRPFDPDNQECQEQLKIWQEKAKTSEFYRNAIETWTIRDVKKLATAKKNNLNYKVIY